MTDIDKLLQIMSDLRDPATGCPWDKKQNFESILPYTIEEAYEVQEAILNDDMPALQDELGDLLLQVVYHSQMAKEANFFNFEDVLNSICEKMVRRHPHVFADKTLETTEQLRESWEQIKQTERQDKKTGNDQTISQLDGVMKTLPALKRAQKLQGKAALVGFDWQDIQPVFDKIREECDELQQEVENNSDKSQISAELGDLLFSIVNLARQLEIDAEISLEKTSRKFTRRFQYIETELEKQSKSPSQCSLDELDQLWEQAKEAGL